MKKLIRKIIRWAFSTDVQFMPVRTGVKIPERVTEGSAAYDALSPSLTRIKYGSQVIPLGFCMAMPDYLSLDCRTRAGYAAKGFLVEDSYGNKIRLKNTIVRIGLIDSDYRNELGVIINCADERLKEKDTYYYVKPDQAIAQLNFTFVPSTKWLKVMKLDETERTGGFGKMNGE